jgi:hypothetical protein
MKYIIYALWEHHVAFFYLGTELFFLKSWRQNCIRRQIGRRQICVRGKLVPTGRTRTIGPILYRRSTSTSRNAVLRARANTVSAVRHTGTREFRRRPLQLITYYISYYYTVQCYSSFYSSVPLGSLNHLMPPRQPPYSLFLPTPVERAN